MAVTKSSGGIYFRFGDAPAGGKSVLFDAKLISDDDDDNEDGDSGSEVTVISMLIGLWYQLQNIPSLANQSQSKYQHQNPTGGLSLRNIYNWRVPCHL